MMKAFSFLTILESLSKKLSILRTKMHSDDLRVDYESITSQLRVSRPFSRTSFADLSRRASFGTSRRVSHFAAILTILFTIGVGSVWGETVLFEPTGKTITSGNITVSTGNTTPSELTIAGEETNGWKIDSKGTITISSTLPNIKSITILGCTSTSGTGTELCGDVKVSLDGETFSTITSGVTIVDADGTQTTGAGFALVKKGNKPACTMTITFDNTQRYVQISRAASNGKQMNIASISVEKVELQTYDITYQSNGGTTIPKTEGAVVIPYSLSVPTKDGCVFVGWYTDSDLTIAAVSGTVLVDNIVLYAKWIEAEEKCITFGSKANISNGTTTTSLDDMTIESYEIDENCTKLGNNSDFLTIQLKNNTFLKCFKIYAYSSNGLKIWFSETNTFEDDPLIISLPTNYGWTQVFDIPEDIAYVKIQRENGSVYFTQICLGIVEEQSCTAPTSVSVSGSWDRFGGETISLTATATGGSGNYTYQWQKKIGDNWTNITDNATATTNNLVYENCDGSHSGTYRCVVSTGTDCSTASAGLQVKVYTLECYNNGTNIYHFTRNGNTQSGTLTLNLNANTAYKFKVQVDNDYYGNGGTINKDETNWVCATTQASNLKVFSGYGGAFTFTIDYSTSGNSNELGEPEVSVTYPENKTIYVIPNGYTSDNAKLAIYYWNDGVSGWSSFLTKDACSGDAYYAEIPSWTGKISIVRLNSDATVGDWEKKWNQTVDITIDPTKDQYTVNTWCENGCNETVNEGTYTPATYSITFNGNGNTGGSMTNVTGITCGGSTTLAANTFTRTGYTFAGWATSANGDVAHADKATISNINENITLYAKWTPNANTAYTVKHYKQQLDGTYSATPDETQNLTGTTAASVTPAVKSYEGFTAPPTQTVTIAADGSTVVEYQYTRNSYKVTWKPAGGNWNSDTNDKVVEHKYGAEIQAPEKPSRTGYEFVEWNPTYTAGTTMPANDVTYTAQWREIAQTYNITYELEPEGWKEGYTPASTYTAGTEYTLPTDGNLTNENYGTFQGWYENNTFTGDAVTTIPADATGDKTYYAKWVYSIKFFEVVDEKTDVVNKEFQTPLTGYPETYTYGIGITLPDRPAKDGYTADGWYSQWCVYYQETDGLGWDDACKFTALANDAYGNVNFAVKYTPTDDATDCPSSGTLYTAVAAATENISIAGNTTDLELNVSTHKTTVTGGSMYVTSQQEKDKDLITSKGFAMTNNNTFFKISMDCELQEGDIISIEVGNDDANERGVWVSSATSRPNSQPECALTATNASLVPVTYTVTQSDEYNGKKVLYIYRATANSTYFNNINISRPVTCTTPTTAFANGSYTVGGSALDLSTLISSKQGSGAITYTVKNANGTGATIAGTSFTATSAGTATVTATQAADGDYCEKVMDATITVTATDEPEPDNCGISECGNATLTYTINASTSVTNTAANLISGTESSNTTALGISGTSVWSNITATDVGKAAAAANECFNPAPVMSSKIKMYKGSSYDTNTYLQFTFTVKSGYTFTPCDVQFIVQPVMTAANFRWVITNGTTEYGSGTANDVPVGQGNGATALLGLSSTSAMPAGTYYIRLYPYDNDDNSFRISNDVILKGTIEEVVCTTPDAPTAFAVGSITSNGATFTITDAANTNNYEIYHSTSNTAPTAETEATITTAEKTKAVTGLTATTTYYAWVRAVCNEEHKSSWVALTNNSFTTSAELTPGDCVTIFEASANTKETFEVTTGSIVSSNLSEGDGLNKDGYKFAVKPNSSNALKIAPKTTGETFKVGDKLTFVVYTAKDEKSIGFKIGSTTYTETISKELYYFTHTLEQGDIQTSDGQTTITFNRNSADDRWVAVKIERCAQLPSCTTPVLSDLENKKVCPGEDVTWTANNTAALQDGETVAYQWTKNSTVLSNDATLTLNDITEAADGTYVVTATVSAEGKASATATKEVKLTVTPATATPTITASASTVYAGNPVTLTATCASSGVTYQWYTCNADGTNPQIINDEENVTLALTPDKAGTYYYKVIVTGDGTYSCGPAEKVYELVVKTPSAGCYDMIIFDSSNDQTIPAVDATGTEANTGASWANVGTSTNSDPCTYTYNDKTYKKGWKFVSGSTSSDNRYIQFVIPEGYTGSLFLAAYSTSTNRTVFIDTKPTKTVNNTYASVHISATGTLGTASAVLNPGTYYVCATDGLHLVELSIEICSDVNCNDPQVTATVNNVNNAIVCEGTENVTFTATNYADEAKFQWQKKDGNTWEEINGATSATYTISSVTTDHAGQYRVIAKKECNRISEEVKLIVLTAPTFNTFATTASVMKGNALAISDVQATNATGYAWYKSSDNSLDAAEDTKVGTSKDLLLAAASITEAADQSFYIFCVASNSCGSVTSNAITVTVTPFVEEECATAGNEGDHEFGFTNTGCGDDTYGDSKTPVWKTNSRKKYLTYTAPEGRYFATAKVTVAHTGGTKCGYAYSTDGGTTWVVKELDGLSTTLTAITIELSELSENVNAFRISRNLTAQDGEKGSDSETFYLAEACFTYKNACTETTLTVGSYNNEYNISTHADFVEPTFTLKSGETTLEGQTLTYTSSNTAIATVDEDGNVTFEGMTGTVTITATFAGGEISETEYCACQGSYTITVGCKDQAPKIVAAAGTNLNGCNNSITLEAKMQDGTTDFTGGSYQWYRDGEAIDGANSASYAVVRAGTYTVSRTDACITMSTNSAIVTNENVEPEVERLTPFQYYHVDKTYSNQMKNRHLFAVTSYGTYEGKRYHLTATRNGDPLNLSSSTAFFTIPSSDNAVDTVMINLNELSGKHKAGDEIVITCAPINSCNNASAITASITIHVIDQTPTLALICSGADGEGTRATKELVVGGDFLTGYNKADLCQQTGNTTFDPNTEWGFYTELKKKYIVTPVNGYAEFNKLNYEPFDILLLTDYPKASKSEAAATILDDMAALCDYRPLLSLKAHMVAKSPSKWAAKGFTTSPVVPAATSQYANIVCYAHPMFDDLDDAQKEGIYHDHDDFNQLVYQILTGPGHESSKGLQGFELKDADNFVTIGLIHYNAAAAVVEHDNHTHLEWTPAADDRQLVAIAERQANIEARMILFAINCGAQSMQTPMGRQVLLTCLDYLLKTDLIEVADCRLTFDNGEGNTNWDTSAYEGTGTKGDGLWSTAANWGPEYKVVPGSNNDVRIAAPCTVDANEVEVLSIHITKDGSLTIPADKSLTARSTILRADENGNVYPTNVEDISLGSNADGNASLILNNERGDTKAGVEMYSKAKADDTYSAAKSTWQYIGTPHSDVQNAAKNYYDSWLYQYDTGTQGWTVIPNGGPLVPFRGYCITHPEQGHTYWMEGTLTATTNQDITIPANKFVVVANSWTAPIQINELTDDDMEGLRENTIYFFNTGSDSNQEGQLNIGRYAAGTYVSVPIHSAPYTGDSYIPSMQGFYVVGGTTDGTLHLDYERHVRAKRENLPSGPMHAPARRVAADDEPQVAKFLFRGTRYDDRLIILERPDFTRGYDSGWDGEQWGGNAAAPMSYVVTETRWDAVSAIPEYEGTVIAFRAGEDSEYTIHFDYDGMEDALYLLDTDTQIYTRVLKGNSYTFTCTDKAEHNRFILTRKAPQIATGTDHINTGENAKAVKFIKDDKIFIFVNGMLYDATGKMVIR